MIDNSLNTERRKHQRHDVSTLAIAVPRKAHSQVARVVNISRGGMAVRYVDQNDWLEEAREIDILVNSDFFLTSLPIQSIRDFKVENNISFSIIRERQCCLQFDPLSPEQESLLDDFIMKYTAGNS
jgi:c-di-GMP-binding flagellar brake protein YcgR